MKKEKKERPCAKKEESKTELLELPPEPKKIQSWIYSEEDFTQKIEQQEAEEGRVNVLKFEHFIHHFLLA